MRTGIVVLVIAIAMMATVQNAAADPVGAFVAQGTVQYEDGTTVPNDWDVWMENLDRPELEGQPWHSVTKWLPSSNDYFIAGETVADSDHIKVTITSPDESYSGTDTMVASEAFNGVNVIINIVVYEVPQETETFTKSLSADWNLISLPLTPTDSSTGAVLGNDTITYDAVYRYDATSKQFVDVTTGTMDTGIGYFVHVTTVGIWEYEGTSVDSTSPGLNTGLNMIGVPNCTMSVDYAMESVDYRYVARWDAADQEFEVYNPSAPAGFQHFNTMEPGEGYFISAKSDYISPPWEINCPS